MFAPILPRPIIPICISNSFLSDKFSDCSTSTRVEGRVSRGGITRHSTPFTRHSLTTPHFLHCGSQPLHSRGYAVVLTKNRRSSHQYVGSCFHGQRRRCRIDPAVNLQFATGLDLLNHLAHPTDLRDGRGNKMLTAKPRINRHDQHLVHVL